jgi:hypothetical protein
MARRSVQKLQIPVPFPKPHFRGYLTDLCRHSQQLHLHFQQRRPHTWKHDSSSTPQRRSYLILRLQRSRFATIDLKNYLLTHPPVPHPLFANFELRIQTDGSFTPREALVSSCRTLVGDLDTLSREFTKEFELRKMVAGDGAAGEK